MVRSLSKKYPYGQFVVPGFPLSERYASMLNLDSGTRLFASPLARRKSQSSAGELIPPGRRQAIPQMAMGSYVFSAADTEPAAAGLEVSPLVPLSKEASLSEESG